MKCVPLCAAGDHADWWKHEPLCPMRMKYWACSNWGSATAPGVADPNCECSMCERRRSDKAKAKGKKS